MNHELAKQLKDAGFKKPESYRGYLKCETCDSNPLVIEGHDESHEIIYYPSLSELIEETMKISNTIPFSILCIAEDNFRVHREGDPVEVSYYGETPEESVARLWLALNKK